MYGLTPRQQAYFVGIRSTFYRLALIIGQGLAVMLAGTLEKRLPLATAWSIAIGSLSILFFLFAIYHIFILPKPSDDKKAGQSRAFFQDFIDTFVSFFKKEHIGQACVLCCYSV